MENFSVIFIEVLSCLKFYKILLFQEKEWLVARFKEQEGEIFLSK